MLQHCVKISKDFISFHHPPLPPYILSPSNSEWSVILSQRFFFQFVNVIDLGSIHGQLCIIMIARLTR